MTDLNIFHRALYVVRKYGGSHLGPSRFQSIQSAAKSAIARSSFNSIVNKHQYPWPGQSQGEGPKRRKSTSPRPSNICPPPAFQPRVEHVRSHTATANIRRPGQTGGYAAAASPTINGYAVATLPRPFSSTTWNSAPTPWAWPSQPCGDHTNMVGSNNMTNFTTHKDLSAEKA